MTRTQIAIRIPDYLLEKLNGYVAQTGESKTEVVIKALSDHLGCAEALPLSQRLTELEERLAKLERLIT